MNAVLAYLDSDAAVIPALAFWAVLLLTAWIIGWRRKRQLLRDRAAFEARFAPLLRPIFRDRDPIEGPALPETRLLADAFGPAGAAVPEYEFVRRLNAAAHRRLARRRAIDMARRRLALLPGPFGSGEDEEAARLMLSVVGLRREITCD